MIVTLTINIKASRTYIFYIFHFEDSGFQNGRVTLLKWRLENEQTISWNESGGASGELLFVCLFVFNVAFKQSDTLSSFFFE